MKKTSATKEKSYIKNKIMTLVPYIKKIGGVIGEPWFPI